MKKILVLISVLFSLNLFAAEYKVQDGLCGKFDYYQKYESCLLIISNGSQQAGVLLDYKYVRSKTDDVKRLIGSMVEVNLSRLLMLSLEEEESVRDYINYPNASYYSASSKEFKFL